MTFALVWGRNFLTLVCRSAHDVNCKRERPHSVDRIDVTAGTYLGPQYGPPSVKRRRPAKSRVGGSDPMARGAGTRREAFSAASEFVPLMTCDVVDHYKRANYGLRAELAVLRP